MTVQTEIETKPEQKEDIGDQWPPLAHLVEWEQYPPKEGDTALCGAKLMGIGLQGTAGRKKVCQKCLEIQRERQERGE